MHIPILPKPCRTVANVSLCRFGAVTRAGAICASLMLTDCRAFPICYEFYYLPSGAVLESVLVLVTMHRNMGWFDFYVFSRVSSIRNCYLCGRSLPIHVTTHGLLPSAPSHNLVTFLRLSAYLAEGRPTLCLLRCGLHSKTRLLLSSSGLREGD